MSWDSVGAVLKCEKYANYYLKRKGETMRIQKQFHSLIFAGFLTLGFASVTMAGQTVTVNAAALANDGAFVIRYEPDMRIFVAGGGIVKNEIGDTDVNGFELLLGSRKYINRQMKYTPSQQLSGFFVEGDITAFIAHMEQYGVAKDQTITRFTGIFGYKWLAPNLTGLTVEFGAGPRVNLANSFGDYEAEKTEAILALNVGYSW
jgi:hypothetical protein